MNSEECIYSIALTQVAGIGPVWAKYLINLAGSAQAVFEKRKELPELANGISSKIIAMLDCSSVIARAEKEYEFIRKKSIKCFTIRDEKYPSRLRECDDAPIVLFYKGDADLNKLRVLNMIGTRNATDYGKRVCYQFLHELKQLSQDVLVVSGLAYGIDIYAHRAAMDNDFPTVGVLAHGLDRIYPSSHRNIAVEMVANGGLLTEFLTGTKPERYNFISRNRIVAGMCDATIVVESAAKGGSLITAGLANSYNRECFAFPGRMVDEYSRGCNKLIQDNKASLIQHADDFVKMMGWNSNKQAQKKEIQATLFPDLSEDEHVIVSILNTQGEMQINQLVVEANIPVNKVNTLLFELEMKGVVRVMAGGMYKLI